MAPTQKNWYLAVDIGASSGRHIAGRVENNTFHLEEIYRFENGVTEKNGRLVWNHEKLFQEIIKGLRACYEKGIHPLSMGIDTWGVDFALVDDLGNLLDDTVAYRDNRTQGLSALVDEKMLYNHTGIQTQPFNTLYQLMALQKTAPALLNRARRMLLMPEYLHYRLTGKKMAEYTNATTTGLVNAASRTWDWPLIDQLGFPRQLFGPLHQPGTLVGFLHQHLAREVGFQTKVVLPPTHDTACAVAAAPIDKNSLFLSSGTWSLMGAEALIPNTSEESRLYALTNEGGVEGTYRHLKNIMGLWILHCLKKEAKDPSLTYGEMARQAQSVTLGPITIDVDDEGFLAPKHMGKAIEAYLKDRGHSLPTEPKALWRLVYNSLAKSYATTAKNLERLNRKAYHTIAIVGGGSQNALLNQLTANACGKTVTAGPIEATALGNLMAQMIAAGEVPSYTKGRELIARSFPIQTYLPGDKVSL